MFKGMGFHFLRFLHSDHRTIVTVVRVGGGGSAEEIYQRKHQKLPLSLLLG
jgi:hypothetical protein